MNQGIHTQTTTSHEPASDTRSSAVNRPLLLAAALAAFTTVVHIFGGGASVATPLVDSTLEQEPRLVALAAWNITSVTLGLSAVALAIGATPRHAAASRYLTLFVSVAWIGFAACFVVIGSVYTSENPLTVFTQWTLLLPVGLLGLWGSRRSKMV